MFFLPKDEVEEVLGAKKKVTKGQKKLYLLRSVRAKRSFCSSFPLSSTQKRKICFLYDQSIFQRTKKIKIKENKILVMV